MGRKGDGKRDRKPRSTKETFPSPVEPPNYDESTPKFCLNHLQSGYGVSELPIDQRADFALALEKRRSMTWEMLYKADRHGLGYESIGADQFHPSIPRAFSDTEKFIVFRYSNLRPMAGVRVRDVFQIVWIEKNFNDLYDHE